MSTIGGTDHAVRCRPQESRRHSHERGKGAQTSGPADQDLAGHHHRGRLCHLHRSGQAQDRGRRQADRPQGRPHLQGDAALLADRRAGLRAPPRRHDDRGWRQDSARELLPAAGRDRARLHHGQAAEGAGRGPRRGAARDRIRRSRDRDRRCAPAGSAQDFRHGRRQWGGGRHRRRRPAGQAARRRPALGRRHHVQEFGDRGDRRRRRRARPSRARRGVARQQARRPRRRARGGPSRARGLVYARGVRAKGRHAARRLRRARRHRRAVHLTLGKVDAAANPGHLRRADFARVRHAGGRGGGLSDGPVTLVVAFTPGGASDVLARILSRKLEQILGQPFVIDNRPGAGGNVAAEAVARAAPDGYTLFAGNNAILAPNAALYKKINFDPEADFAPIGLIGSQANILVVNPALPVQSMGELIALAKANPGKLNFASSGHGLAAHLAGELFKVEAKIDIVHVPYKGAAPALQDVIAGHVQMMFATASSVAPHIRDGKVRPLAVATLKRTAVLPDIPTIHELGIKNFDATTWHGLVAPAHTPKDVIATLNRALAVALDDPTVKTSLGALGVDIIGGTPEAFAAYIRSEIPKWTAIIKASGAKLD